jgi:hypothetical protein
VDSIFAGTEDQDEDFLRYDLDDFWAMVLREGTRGRSLKRNEKPFAVFSLAIENVLFKTL